MAGLSFKNIYKVYPNGVKAVNDFNMEIEDKEFIVFVGPSGCGKSTTLRMIAGLEEISAGELKIGDVCVNDMDCRERDTAMVFQNYALYPHFTVYENMAFPLKMNKVPKEQIKEKVTSVAKILGLEDYLGKKPAAMSGGQRQRVALGRAIVREPQVFLLDEPLSNLDAKLRTQMRSEITKLHQRLRTTFIYVTHDQTEAMTMGDRIVVMKDGYIQQIDTPVNLYAYPDNKFVAGFIGTPPMNFYDAKIVSSDAESFCLEFADGKRFSAPASALVKLERDYLEGKEFILGFRPESVDIAAADDGNAVECTVNQTELLGSETLLYCDFSSETGVPYEESPYGVVIKADGSVAASVGSMLKLKINPDGLHFFDRETERCVCRRIPSYNEPDAVVSDGRLIVAGKEFALPPELLSLSGGYRLSFPPQAFYESEDGEEFRIAERESIGNRYLFRFQGSDLFMLSDSPAGETVRVKPDFKQIAFYRDGHMIKDRFGCENRLSGILKKRRLPKEERKTSSMSFAIDFVAGDISFECPYELCKRILGASDRKIFNVPTELNFGENAIIFGDKIAGEVKSVLNYGDASYVLAETDKGAFRLPSSFACGGKVSFDLDMEKVKVTDLTLNIIIA